MGSAQITAKSQGVLQHSAQACCASVKDHYACIASDVQQNRKGWQDALPCRCCCGTRNYVADLMIFASWSAGRAPLLEGSPSGKGLSLSGSMKL